MHSGRDEKRSGRSDPDFNPAQTFVSEEQADAFLDSMCGREETLAEMIERRDRMKVEAQKLTHQIYARAIQENRYNTSAAARSAGVSRQYLNRWLLLGGSRA